MKSPREIASEILEAARCPGTSGALGFWETAANGFAAVIAKEREESYKRGKDDERLSRNKCEGCGTHGDIKLIRVYVTNGVLSLCRTCLDDINRKNPVSIASEKYVETLKREMAYSHWSEDQRRVFKLCLKWLEEAK
jgi:hypothetical protein